MAEGKSGGGVQSVERVFDLLNIITASGGESSLSDLAHKAELPLPTIHRLLRTLVPLGYVRQLPNRSYALGPGLIRLGYTASLQLGTYAQPVLQQLVQALGESANMAVLNGRMVVYVGQAQSSQAMRMFTEVGRRANLHDEMAGLILGMIQAATSINEQTLSFVPKLLVVAVSIMIFGSLILGLLSDFTVSIFERIPDLVK